MQEIRNSKGRLVCRADKDSKTVEIVVKSSVTVIRFLDKNGITVKNTERKK